jgi:uncharacterized protein (TIGR04255 family)
MLFKNAVVQEAICFLGFEATAGEDIFSAYYERVRQEYPNFTPVPQQTITWGFSPEGPLPPQQSLQQLMRYSRQDRSALLTLAPDTLALHLLRPYPGWEEVLTHIRFAWGKMVDTIRPTAVTRLGLRYINAIPSHSETERLGYWLKSNDFLPPAVLDSYPMTPCYIEKNSGPEDTHRVSVAKVFSGKEPYGVFVWEIERVRAGRFDTSTDQVAALADELHRKVRFVFDTAVGPNLEILMNSEPKQ